MCGINGFNFSNQNLIEKMNEKIEYRGPDDTGIFIDNEISLGHNRLSIIDLSKLGHQPMESNDKNYIIIYNGELYNFKEIKKDLENNGFNFHSNTDTEVILNAYIYYGKRCLQKFNGIFAFAIWDKKNKELFIVRDHFGVKPLFYYFKDNKFIFSSEIKSIFEHDINKKINIDALNMYFRFLYIPGPITIFENIKKLEPGHFLILKNGNINIERYYNLPNIENKYSYEDVKFLIREKFDNAVKRQLISDRPLGIFLSGGIDSTAILGSMSKIVSHKIKTFTVKFDINEEKFNEDSFFAKKNSEYYNTEHHEFIVSPKDFLENIQQVIYHMDDLVSNPTQIATYLLSREAKKYVDVVLGGDGGDEIFGGYDRYYYYYNLIDKLQRIPKIIRDNKFNYKIAKTLGKTKEYNKINVKSGVDLFWEFAAQKEFIIEKFLKPDIRNLEKNKNAIVNNYFNLPFKNYSDYMMKVDFSTWLTDESLSRSDKLTMAFALEQRVPILDKELVDLAFSIPYSYKLDNKKQGKKIFKEAVKDYLPNYLYNKPKSGWFSPTAKWLRIGLKDMAYEILSPEYNNETKQFFDFDSIRRILDNHIDKKEYALNTIWSLINFQVWYRQNFK